MKKLTNDRSKILEGLYKTADVVGSTMGADGKVVIIWENGKLRFTKDGVSVARSFEMQDRLEKIGSEIVIAAANETVAMCGDGTTLTSIWVKEFTKALLNWDGNINEAFRYYEKVIQDVEKYLKENAKEITSIDEAVNIATISANSRRIGELFRELLEEAGLDVLVHLEENRAGKETTYELVKGIEYEGGYIHPSFMTHKGLEHAIYENVYVHISDTPLSMIDETLKNLVRIAFDEKVPVLFIAPHYSEAVLRFLSMNKTQQGTPLVAVKTPGYGYGQKKNIDDITAFLSEDNMVDKVVVTSHNFVLYNEDTPYLEDRINLLKELQESAIEPYDERDYFERAYKLKGTTAVIYAGGTTPEEMKEEYDRVEDALGAFKSAMDEGYVVGGGLSLYTYSLDLKDPAVQIILQAPIHQIYANANIEWNIPGKGDIGLDIRTKEVVNYFEAGIIDPAKVLYTALKNAYSSAKLLANSSYVLYDVI
jgi:chaperonin GroEL